MNSNKFDEDFNYSPHEVEKPGAYPIFSYTYVIIRLESMTDCTRAVELYGYINWFMNSEEARLVHKRDSELNKYDCDLFHLNWHYW